MMADNKKPSGDNEVGYGIELDPQYCDVIVRRMARAFKVEAVHAATAKPFAQIERERAAEAAVDRPREQDSSTVEEVV